MICPACGSEQPDPPGRFCAACALALPVVRARPAAPPPEEGVRCVECGVVAPGERCPGCGARVRRSDERVKKTLPRSD